MSETLSNSHGHLRSLIERVERLEEDKATIQADIKEVYSEAKATGFDTRIMRMIVRIRKQDPAQREEQEALLATYMAALGMLPEDEAAAA